MYLQSWCLERPHPGKGDFCLPKILFSSSRAGALEGVGAWKVIFACRLPQMCFPSFSRAGALGLKKWTSNSCTADKENPRKSEAETMYVPHSARYSEGAQAPNVPLGLTLYQLSYWLALVSANLFSNVLTYFFYGCAATNPFLHVLRVCFSARAASVLDGCPELSLEALFPHNSKLGNYGEFAKPSPRASLQQWFSAPLILAQHGNKRCPH